MADLNCRSTASPDRQELDKLHLLVDKLQKTLDENPRWRLSSTEATLLDLARGTISKRTMTYEASVATESVAGSQGIARRNSRVAEWVGTLASILRDQRLSDPPDEAYMSGTSAPSVRHSIQESEAVETTADDSDDDLDTDLAKAALHAGTIAFEKQEWLEADSLLQEALRILQQLPKQQRGFCDIISLQYRLAVCTYRTQEPTEAEEALLSLSQLSDSACSDQHRRYICDATHLLSCLHVRMSQFDRAKVECEKALQARRRLLGKRSDASLESTALLAHIYFSLDSRARAKAYIAMIPEARRDDILKTVEKSLGTTILSLDSSSPIQPIPEDADLAVRRQMTLRLPMENRCYGPVSSIISQLPAASFQEADQQFPSPKADTEDLRSVQSVAVTSRSSLEERSQSVATEKDRPTEVKSSNSETLSPSVSSTTRQEAKGNALSRKQIIDRIGCQPRDRIEEAVCAGDHSAFTNLLGRKKDFWRSKMRKRTRPERVTALHFAALFGEMDMARDLLDSGFDINAVPFGYTTSHTPLKFAIGARKVDMVNFLVASGARPSEPDSWPAMAGQLMNRSWLMMTLSEDQKAEGDQVQSRMISILKILLKQPWDVNSSFTSTGATMLHQAVTFWTGAYKWDLNLRAAMTAFLCEQGADPYKPDTDGKTPYDLASASGHQDLLLILNRGSPETELDGGSVGPVELSDGDHGSRIQLVRYA